MCNSDYDSSDYDSSDYEESCSGICCPEYDYTLDCGCCPCKGIQVPLIRILTDEMRREIYNNMIDLTPWTSRYANTNDDIESTWEKTRVQTRKTPKKKVSSTKKDSKPKVGQKKMKRTQTERTKARQMRKRQDKLNEIASKERVVPQVNNASLPTEMKSIPVESKLATTSKPPQKKRPKTHFRKTKKPGRA